MYSFQWFASDGEHFLYWFGARGFVSHVFVCLICPFTTTTYTISDVKIHDFLIFNFTFTHVTYEKIKKIIATKPFVCANMIDSPMLKKVLSPGERAKRTPDVKYEKWHFDTEKTGITWSAVATHVI